MRFMGHGPMKGSPGREGVAVVAGRERCPNAPWIFRGETSRRVGDNPPISVNLKIQVRWGGLRSGVGGANSWSAIFGAGAGQNGGSGEYSKPGRGFGGGNRALPWSGPKERLQGRYPQGEKHLASRRTRSRSKAERILACIHALAEASSLFGTWPASSKLFRRLKYNSICQR